MEHEARSRGSLFAAVLISVFAAACGDDPTAPAGSLQVTTVTTGEVALALDGYSVLVASAGSRTIGPNASISFTDVPLGSVEVELSGVSDDCSIGGPNPRVVEVTAATSGHTTFDLTCASVVYLQKNQETIQQTFLYDLDTGLGTGGQTSLDIWFQAESPTERFLTPQNTAVSARYGTSAPGKGGCLQTTLSTARINIQQLTVGTFVCVRTTENRISAVEITQASLGAGQPLGIRFTTWR